MQLVPKKLRANFGQLDISRTPPLSKPVVVFFAHNVLAMNLNQDGYYINGWNSLRSVPCSL
jgi:hypothetical protein